MGPALVEFAEQADIEVLYDDEDVADLTTGGVAGASSRDEALDRLLKGSGLRFNFEADDLLVVRPASEAAARDGRIKLNAVLPDNGGQLAQVSEAGQRQARAGDTGRLQVASADLGEDDGEADMEEMIVTGSNIRGARSASPVFVFDRDDIDITGVSTVPQFIQTLPQNFGGGVSESTGPVPSGAGNLNRGTGINLRGLGNDSTLVLLNGRRLAPANTGNFVDVSMIPLTVIERVEVLTDGASAIYGSDAVGGVVNFVTRRDYDGAETRLRYGSATTGDLDEAVVGQTFGKAWDSGHALISYEFRHRDELDANDRSFTEEADDPTDVLPRQTRHSVFLTGGQDLTERVNVFADGYFTTRDSSFRNVNASRAAESIEGETEQYGASLGLQARLNENWQAELAGAFSENTVSTEFIELKTGDATDSNDLTSATWSVSGRADGAIFSLPGGDIKLAIGGQFRRETYEENIAAPRSSFIPDIDEARNNYAFFGEMFVPLVSRANRRPALERLELTLAGRYEDYSDFGSSTDSKFGLLWSPVQGLAFRGTWGTSFRVPLFRELTAPGSPSGFLVFFPDSSVPTGSTLAAFARGINPDLQPETATTWTAGFNLAHPSIPALDISMTYFNIDYEDRIAAASVLFDAFTDPRWEPVIDRSPDQAFLSFLGEQPFSRNFTGGAFEFTDADALVDARLRNLARVQTRGLDFAISYVLQSRIGSLGFNLGGTYLFEQLEQLIETEQPFDLVGTAFNPPNLKMRGGINWNYEGFAANLAVNYVDGFRNEQVDPPAPVDSWTTVDLRFSYNTGENFHKQWLQNILVSIIALNVLDQDPPFVTSFFEDDNLNYDPTNANAVGRTLAIQISKSW